MIQRVLGAGSVVLVLLMSYGRLESAENQQEAVRQKLSMLVQEMQAGRVGKVAVFQIDPSAMFRTEVTPELLEKWWDYEFIVRRLNATQRGKLAEVFRAAMPRHGDDKIDVRSAVIFYSSKDDTRVATLYFDRGGNHGFIGSLPVVFHGDIFASLKRIIAVNCS